jgi:hypothetical protein
MERSKQTRPISVNSERGMKGMKEKGKDRVGRKKEQKQSDLIRFVQREVPVNPSEAPVRPGEGWTLSATPNFPG